MRLLTLFIVPPPARTELAPCRTIVPPPEMDMLAPPVDRVELLATGASVSVPALSRSTGIDSVRLLPSVT